MIFHSLEYALFLLVVFSIYWLLPKRGQNYLLLCASYLFYGWVHIWYVALLALTSIVDFTAARGIESQKHHRKKWLALSLGVNFSILFFCKYLDFFSGGHVLDVLHAIGFTWLDEKDAAMLLPVGISFYTFQSASYVVDVFRGQIQSRRHLPDYLLFVSFFPQLVAGPIERAGHLLNQIEQPRRFHWERSRSDLLLILWGLVKKLVVADNAAVVCNKVFSLTTPPWPVLWAGVFAFGIQIYADFSAYSDMARGSARLLGFDLMRNFRHPYNADSPADFWRRWHISLSTWFRDYVYIPLGGSRGGELRTVLNVMITFLLSGLWHGASWNFVLWGAWHGFLLIAWRLWEAGPSSLSPQRIPRAARVALVYVLVLFGWLLFRETQTVALIRYLTLNPLAASAMDWRVAIYLVLTVCLYALPLLVVSSLEKQLIREGWVSRVWPRNSVKIQVALGTLLLLVLVLLRSPQSSDFIYFQF
jgi:D-alanyl-lipoteichoic acid acyltransferase DltB (MBOAT superfamily)